MKITINAFGSRGDVQPYVALGIGLQGAGHQVRVTTHRIFEGFVRQYGLLFHPLDVNPRQVLVNQAVADLGTNTFRIMRWMQENFTSVLGDIFRATLESARDADLLLNSGLSFASYHVAQKLDIPTIASYLWPAMPTQAFQNTTSPISPPWLPFKGIYNRLSTKFSNQLFFNMMRPLTNACRAEVLGLPPLSAAYYWGVDSPSAKVPILYGYSPRVVPKPSDWGDNQQVTGYWFLDMGIAYQPPPELETFLAHGSKPVYVGFGSMVDHKRDWMTRLVVEALDRAGQRAVLLGGWSQLGEVDLPETILKLDFVPHDWLFPHMAAVVHHGGAGTTAAGLMAGCPTVVVSFFGDQSFWGWRVRELGVGPKWIPRKKLSVDKLAAAIQQAVTDQAMGERAASVGELIRAENGVEKAVKLIEAGFGLDYRV